MKSSKLYILSTLLLLAGCIKNDLPFPRIQQDILTLAAEGETAAATIDTKTLTATLHLDESVNPRAVRFTDFTYTEGADCSKNLLEGTYDLTEPLQLTLSLYQNYTWTITADQTIERYLTIAGQIGETAIDVPGKRIVLYVPQTADLHKLRLTSIKLGPAGVTEMSPALKAGDDIDASKPVKIQLTYFGQTEYWTLYVDTSTDLVSTTQADAWVNVVWVYGSAPEDADNGFQYRRADSSEWITVPKSDIVFNGGSFYTCIPHLSPMTSYVVRAYSGDTPGNEMEVTTGVGIDLPNADFEAWWQDGKVWCPWPQGEPSWWETGNKGASTLGQSNVTPSTDTPTGTGLSAKLETRFVGIGIIGKLAAGSIFSGVFVQVDGTNGILDFGRPWDARPTKLHGYYNYTTSPINYASDEFKPLLDRPDSCQIWIALTDMDAPCRIRTNPKNRQLFDRNDPGVIAYGELCSGDNSNGWKPFEIQLEYKATDRKPRYLIVVCAGSKYGDYFTGGTGSVLLVDDLSLSYDY